MKSIVVILAAFLLCLSYVESKTDVRVLQELIRELNAVAADTVPDADNQADIINPISPIDTANSADAVDPTGPKDVIGSDPEEPVSSVNPSDSVGTTDLGDPKYPSDLTDLGDATYSDDSVGVTDLDPAEPIDPTYSVDSTDTGDPGNSEAPSDLGNPTGTIDPIDTSEQVSQADHASLDSISQVNSPEAQEMDKPSALEKSAISLARLVDKLTKMVSVKAEEIAKANEALEDSPAGILSVAENVALEQEQYELLAIRLSEMKDDLKEFFGKIYQQLSEFSEQLQEPNPKASESKYGSKAVKTAINFLKTAAADPKKRNNDDSSSMLKRLLQKLQKSMNK